MAERLYSSQTPETDSNDPGTKHTYGMRLAFSVGGTIAAGRIWCPNPKPPTYFGWALFRVSDQALLSSVDLTAVTLTAGAWNDVTLGSTVTISSSETYVVAAHYEGGHQVFSTSSVPFPLSNGSHITADTGVFVNDGTPSTYPGSTFALYGFADVEFATTATVTGTASAVLGALSDAATGVRTTFGTATRALGGIVASAAGVRTAFGTAVAGLGALGGTAAGVRTVHGTGAAALGPLSGASTGRRATSGTAAAPLGGLVGSAAVITVNRGSSTPTVSARRTSTDAVSANRTSTPTVTGG